MSNLENCSGSLKLSHVTIQHFMTFLLQEIDESNEEGLLRDAITQFFMQFKASFVSS